MEHIAAFYFEGGENLLFLVSCHVLLTSSYQKLKHQATPSIKHRYRGAANQNKVGIKRAEL